MINVSLPPDQFFPHGVEYSPRLGTFRHGCCLFPRVCGKPRRKKAAPSGTLHAPPKNQTHALQFSTWPTCKRGVPKEGRAREVHGRARGKFRGPYPISYQTLLPVPWFLLSFLSLLSGQRAAGAQPSTAEHAAAACPSDPVRRGPLSLSHTHTASPSPSHSVSWSRGGPWGAGHGDEPVRYWSSTVQRRWEHHHHRPSRPWDPTRWAPPPRAGPWRGAAARALLPPRADPWRGSTAQALLPAQIQAWQAASHEVPTTQPWMKKSRSGRSTAWRRQEPRSMWRFGFGTEFEHECFNMVWGNLYNLPWRRNVFRLFYAIYLSFYRVLEHWIWTIGTEFYWGSCNFHSFAELTCSLFVLTELCLITYI